MKIKKIDDSDVERVKFFMNLRYMNFINADELVEVLYCFYDAIEIKILCEIIRK